MLFINCDHSYERQVWTLSVDCLLCYVFFSILLATGT